VNDFEFDPADAKGVAVFETYGIVLAAVGFVFEPVVFPVIITAIGDVGLETGLGELAGAGKKIGVDVCFGDGDQSEAVSPGLGDVPIDIALGVDDDCFTGALAPDEITRLCQKIVVDQSE
jgi:hypothetical protein